MGLTSFVYALKGNTLCTLVTEHFILSSTIYTVIISTPRCALIDFPPYHARQITKMARHWFNCRFISHPSSHSNG